MLPKDYQFMFYAIEEAMNAKDNYGRVGAVITLNDELIARAGSDSTQFPVLHAECSALQKIGWFREPSIKKGSVIYLTIQPCMRRSSGKPGCSFELVGSGLEKIVYGGIDPSFSIPEQTEFFKSHGIELVRTPYPELREICWQIFYRTNKNYDAKK